MNDPHPKLAGPSDSIHPLIARRWSPYALEPRTLPAGALATCLEAARWAASSYNEQPWYFLVADREDSERFATMLRCLVEPNRAWAQHASALLLTVASTQFSRNGKPNKVATHDIGLAAANFTMQAGELGLVVHQMAGILLDVIRETYDVPEDHLPLTAIAIGYSATEPTDETAELFERDQQPRTRKPLCEFVFQDRWGQAHDGV